MLAKHGYAWWAEAGRSIIYPLPSDAPKYTGSMSLLM